MTVPSFGIPTNDPETTYVLDPHDVRGRSIDITRCAHLCCAEHLAQCPDDGSRTGEGVVDEVTGDVGLRRCDTCEVRYCPPHLKWHSCEWQRALRIALVRGEGGDV